MLFRSLRFDYRGMGDSEGPLPHFESCGDDIAAAIDCTLARVPGARRVVLWGLCDGASAALLYLNDRRDERVLGLCLVNPWARSNDGHARAQVKHYYARRLLQPAFWRKLLGGGVALSALRDASRAVAMAARRGSATKGGARAAAPRNFREGMAVAAGTFGGPVLMTISGEDLTAREFLDYAAHEPTWRALMQSPSCRRIDLPGADHTLSDPADESRLHQTTLDWLEAIAAQTGGLQRPI